MSVVIIIIQEKYFANKDHLAMQEYQWCVHNVFEVGAYEFVIASFQSSLHVGLFTVITESLLSSLLFQMHLFMKYTANTVLYLPLLADTYNELHNIYQWQLP